MDNFRIILNQQWDTNYWIKVILSNLDRFEKVFGRQLCWGNSLLKSNGGVYGLFQFSRKLNVRV